MANALSLLKVAESIAHTKHGSCDLDADIYVSLGYEVIRRPVNPNGISWKYRGTGLALYPHPRWVSMNDVTRRIDEAIRLVPAQHAWSVRRNISADGDVIYCNAQVWKFSDPRDSETITYWANSPEDEPALAICAAALKALAATMGAT